MFSVSDDEILSAMKQLIQEAHIFPEPSGSPPLAVLSKPENLNKLGDRVVLVVSGGNVSLSLLTDCSRKDSFRSVASRDSFSCTLLGSLCCEGGALSEI